MNSLLLTVENKKMKKKEAGNGLGSVFKTDIIQVHAKSIKDWIVCIENS